MMDQLWFAFNTTPKLNAKRVCEILERASHSVLADGSRFDGHVKRLPRILERAIMLRFFEPQYHGRLNEALNAQIALPGTTAEGRRYHSGYGRGSGSIETSDFNSALGCFIGYCAWRNTLKDGVKYTPEQAWQCLGIYGGDDSLEGPVDPTALKTSATMMGQDYEIEVVARGELGVNFLNRQFGPDVWNGDASSMANPSRLLSKLWVGPSQLHDPLIRFGERMSGYYRMDRNSPVIGDIAQLSHELLGECVDGVLTPWDGRCPVESNWPNVDSGTGWMLDVFNKFLPDFDFDRFNTWIQEVRDGGDASALLRAPLCTASPDSYPAVKVACVVGDELMLPAPKPTDAWEAEALGEVPKGEGEVSAVVAEPSLAESQPTYAQVVVAQADALVPIVGAHGQRVDKWPKPKPASSGAPKLKVAPVQSTDFQDPKNWAKPARKSKQTEKEYSELLKLWEEKRARVVSKRGSKRA